MKYLQKFFFIILILTSPWFIIHNVLGYFKDLYYHNDEYTLSYLTDINYNVIYFDKIVQALAFFLYYFLYSTKNQTYFETYFIVNKWLACILLILIIVGFLLGPENKHSK